MCGKANLPPHAGMRGWLQGSAGLWATGCHCPACLVPTMPISTALFQLQSVCDLQALQACFMALAGPQSPQMMMEGYEPDPLEGPGAFPWAWCHAALLCCMPSWRGQGLLAAPQPPWGRASPHWPGPSAVVCSSGMPGTFQTPEGMARPSPPAPAAHAEHAGEWPGSPSGPRSKPCDRPADRQTDLRRQRARTASAGLSGAGLLPSPAVGACPCGAVPFLPCPGSRSASGSAGSAWPRHTS